MSKFAVILPAAGKSSRFGDKNYKKPFTSTQHDALGADDYLFTYFKEGEILPLTN